MRDPEQYEAILADSADFEMASDKTTGQWLRAMAASKGNGRFLDLGTGTGLSACWILDGMDTASALLTVDNNPELVTVAKKHLAHDPRIEFILEDGEVTLRRLNAQGAKFDFIFADTWPGKIYHRDLALSLLDDHGLYLVDDMLPRPDWPEEHAANMAGLVADLKSRESLVSVMLNDSSGLMMCVKRKTKEQKT
jgi:predicted O-methyltransferase YrrM